MIADEELHRHAAENIARADALLFGRVTYEMMEAAWRPVAETGVRPDWMPDWMEPFARTIDAAKKYVVSSTLDRVDWNAELLRGDHLETAVHQLKQQSGRGLFVGGMKLPLALAELGLIDEYEFHRPPKADRPRADAVRGNVEACRPEAGEPLGVRLRGGGDALRTQKLMRLPCSRDHMFGASGATSRRRGNAGSWTAPTTTWPPA